MASEKIAMSQQTLVDNERSHIGNQKWTQYLAALIATIGGFIAGTTLGWTAPAGPMLQKGQYPFSVTNEDIAWIGAFMPLGAMLGCPVTAWLVDKLGRKNMMLMLVAPCLIGWGMIIWAESVMWICMGRLLSGFAGGAYSIIVPLYTSELAEKEIRGTLGTYFQLQIVSGILFTYIVGSYLNVFGLSIACAVIPVIYVCLMILMPETPIFHLMKGNVDKARLSLRYFRGPYGLVDQELSNMQDSLAKTERERVPIMEAFQTTPAKRGLFIGLGVMLLQQFTGCNAVIFYATFIFNEAGSAMPPNTSTIIVGIMSVLATYVSTLIVDRLGRKILLLCSAIMMGICTALIGVFFYLKDFNYDVSSIGFIPLVSLCVFIVLFSLGFGPIPWMLIGEIFPAQIKGTACSVACLFNWFFAFLVTKFFSSLVATIHIYNTFWLFTLFSIFGVFFVITFVPETKGRTMDEIQEMLGASNDLSPANQANSTTTKEKY
ncbi:facilitated trehalose transporter Tret1-like isoform X2 [Adelges cooleyi]|nr:facilitated trehalose transporter Tret1-like isoform X2 [Adelges cooleyi]XP_050430729.1 facilitated trehalose transporter Tret1-like isoform X2 [Adelges cooleyi]XP_050430730.1 facilitated trehalose transporter Tret1-like isoform X2 [Adelges cooleyi]